MLPKKKKKNTQIHEILKFLFTNKEKKKKKLIRDKVRTKNVNIKVIK